MSKRRERLNELKLSGKTFYFRGSTEDVIFKFVNGEGYFIKWPGEKEKPISPKTSNLLMDSLLEFNESTKKEYDEF